MIKLLADENFNNQIVRGVLRRVPTVEILRVQDTELEGKPDPLVLNWAAQHDYIVITHDVNTMRGYFYTRLEAALPVSALFLVPFEKPVGEVIDSLELILLASDTAEWVGKVHYLPI